MFDRMQAIMSATESVQSNSSTESEKFAATLVIKYVAPQPQFIDLSQPKDECEICGKTAP